MTTAVVASSTAKAAGRTVLPPVRGSLPSGVVTTLAGGSTSLGVSAATQDSSGGRRADQALQVHENSSSVMPAQAARTTGWWKRVMWSISHGLS